MAWVTFTEDDVKSVMLVREAEKIDSMQRKNFPDANGDPTPPEASTMAKTISMVCNRFRGAIMANPNVTYFGPAGTLPDFCIFSAAIIARDARLGIPPVEIGVTNPRQKENDAALKFLESLKDMPAAPFLASQPVGTIPDAGPLYGGDASFTF